jgi:hypothetical protein
MDHVGIDVHKRESQICLLTEGGRADRASDPDGARTLRRRTRRSTPSADRDRSPTDSEWVARCLESLGPDRRGANQ